VSSSLAGAVDTPEPTTADPDNPVAEGGAARPQATVQAYGETMQPTAVATPQSRLSRPSGLPVEVGTPVGPVLDSRTEGSGSALHRAEEATDAMKTWNSAVGVIKRVMDTVSPIAEVCPISLLSMLR
jgi:hypothetical protein